jgi:hypothetical protein
MQDREEKVDTSAEWVLKALHCEAVADIADLYTESGRLELYTNGRLYGALG